MTTEIVVVTDLRFTGGTAAALLHDIASFLDLGYTVGICPVVSQYFTEPEDRLNAAFLELIEAPKVRLIESGPVHARVVFFHHPMLFATELKSGARKISCEKSIIVAHHPAFRGDGSLEYNPVGVQRNLRREFGTLPQWAPVSGTIRAQLRNFTPLIRLTSEDWINMFISGDWQPDREIFSCNTPIVGRHSRSDSLKWPDTAEVTLSTLDPGPDWQARVMGCPPSVQEMLGQSHNIEFIPFAAEPVDSFLSSIDVFSYFYHSRWTEAFGRTVVEAMLMERPCVLDPRLKTNFDGLAHFPSPDDAAAVIRSLRDNRRESRDRAKLVREKILNTYGSHLMEKRLNSMLEDNGSVSRRGEKSATILTTIRKSLGLMLRTHSV